MNKALYRKYNDGSHNSSKYHKLDGTPIRAILKRESQEIISESLDNQEKKEYNSSMKETLIAQMIRIAKEHGHNAEENASGGVNVYIEFIDKDGNLGIETYPVNNLHQLKIALGY